MNTWPKSNFGFSAGQSDVVGLDSAMGLGQMPNRLDVLEIEGKSGTFGHGPDHAALEGERQLQKRVDPKCPDG